MRYLLLTGVLVGAVGIAGRYLAWPLLTSTVGPTAYVFAAHPGSEAARFRNALIGHAVAIACGLAALPSSDSSGTRRSAGPGRPPLAQVAAAVPGVGLTVLSIGAGWVAPRPLGGHRVAHHDRTCEAGRSPHRPGAGLGHRHRARPAHRAPPPNPGSGYRVRAAASLQGGRVVTRPTRCHGFAPIAGYAIVGDGRTAALVAADGRVDSVALPGARLPTAVRRHPDPEHGGYFALRPACKSEVSRRYLDGSNVLESTYRTAEGSVAVTQALNLGTSGRLPWTEFAHRVVGLSGHVEMHWEWRPGDRFGRVNPWVRRYHGIPISLVGDQYVALVRDDHGEMATEPDGVAGGSPHVQGHGRPSPWSPATTSRSSCPTRRQWTSEWTAPSKPGAAGATWRTRAPGHRR